jgi:pimeloyl-ACP methyl ester carboxylesterase
VSYVDANGVHTHYEENGSGDPLLLLHGGLADASGFALSRISSTSSSSTSWRRKDRPRR